MIAAPAVDLRGGRCVQLVGGRPEEERVSLPDPVEVARRWWDAGFGTLHVVDLDAALGDGDNRELIREVVAATGARTHVGGGIRSDEVAEELLGMGADAVVVGTRAVDDPEWLRALAEAHPGAVIVAADVRGGQVLVRGWKEASALSLADFLHRLEDLPLAGVLCTDVGREGQMVGVDADALRELVEATGHPAWASGGIASIDDLRTIAAAGAAGAVMGMALYTGALDPEGVAREYGR